MSIGLFSAFLLGFWGSLHCVGMCGGIVGVLNQSIVNKDQLSRKRKLFIWSAYHGGRIISYSIAGGLAALLGSSLFSIINPDYAHKIGMILSGLFMIAFGLYLSGWWMGLMILEKKGDFIWQRLKPFSKKFLPVEHVYQAFVLGGLWGWLPCGLVYASLVWMFTVPSVTDGIIYMAAFGVGTLPMLILMSTAAAKISKIVKKSWVRKTAGVCIIIFGVLTVLGLLNIHAGHENHTGHDMHSEHQKKDD